MGENAFAAMRRAIDMRDASMWLPAMARIANERSAIEMAINSGGDAYGFTSLLGPLDDLSAGEDYQDNLLRWHLIGRPSEIATRCGDWISAVKLQQLSLGGSGITPATFSALADRFAKGICYKIDLDASYSSADVVPASWWVQSVFGDPCHLERQGDLIALINGNFVSIGLIAYATERLIEDLCGILASLSAAGLKGYGATETQEAIVDMLHLEHAGNDRPQRSVLSRDCIPMVTGILADVSQAIKVICTALMHQSGNPLFRFDEDKVSAVSNSSFLDFSISSAAMSLAHATRLAARLLNKVISIVCTSAEERSSRDPKWIQYPKVTLGYCIAIEGGQVGPMQLTGEESGGVEDLWDTGLISTNCLLRQLDILDKELAVAFDCFGTAELDHIQRLTFSQLMELCMLTQ